MTIPERRKKDRTGETNKHIKRIDSWLFMKQGRSRNVTDFPRIFFCLEICTRSAESREVSQILSRLFFMQSAEFCGHLNYYAEILCLQISIGGAEFCDQSNTMQNLFVFNTVCTVGNFPVRQILCEI